MRPDTGMERTLDPTILAARGAPRRPATTLQAITCLGLLAALGACSEEPVAASDSQDAAIDSHTAAGLSVLKVQPNRGPLTGGDEIDVEGEGFGPNSKVFFGKNEAEVTWRAGGSRLFAIAPPALVPGPVDVRVVDGARQGALPVGFAYLAEVRVEAIEPSQGPDTGGTPILVRGKGFHPGDRVLIGWRQALDCRYIDSETLSALTPARLLPADQGTLQVPVAVRHGSGVTSLAGTYRYGRVPHLDSVKPVAIAVGADAGGRDVTAYGSGLGAIEIAYVDGRQGLLAAGSADTLRALQVPTLATLGGAPRAVGLAVVGPFGAATRDPALVYLGAAKATLYGLLPAQGSTVGGDTAALLVDPAGGEVVSARIGGKEVVGLAAVGASLKTPALAAGSHDLEVKVGAVSLSLANAYRAWAPIAAQTVAPASGPLAGGNSVELQGTGLVADCAVQIGAFAAQVQSASAKGLKLKVPAGAAGAADVRVRCGPHEVELPAAYAYLPMAPQIDALTPATGATGGGGLVTVHGAGLDGSCSVAFGGAPAKVLEVIGSAALRVETPPHAAGPVTVQLVCAKGADALIDGFLYHSPTSPQGGTHGEPLDGTLHVTVLDIYTLKPIVGATVVVGQPGQPGFGQFIDKTDAKGQSVFSSLALQPPLTVSASKFEYSASSIVKFDVANATLLLFPYVPPSPGGGGGPGLPLATLSGTILDLDKYALMPPTSCLKPSTGGPICDFCQDVSTCGAKAEWTCALTGGTTRRCFPRCKTDNDCPETHRCFDDVEAVGERLCKPAIGVRRITCETSTRGLETENPPPGAGSVVNEKTGAWSISARLDELAVYCVAGYVMADQSFVPTSMGVLRHLFPTPGGTLQNLGVRLDIPLQRTLALRLDGPQRFFPAGSGGTLRVQSWQALGSDGFIPLASIVRLPEGPGATGVVHALPVPFQPLTLPEAMTDTSQTWRAVVDFGGGVAPIEAGTRHEGIIRPGDHNLLLRGPGGGLESQALAIALPLAGLLGGDGDEVMAVAANGRLYRGPLDNPSLIHSPEIGDLYGDAPALLAAAGTPTDATLVGEGGLVRRLRGDELDSESGALVEDLVAVCHGKRGRLVVGDKGGVAFSAGGVPWGGEPAPPAGPWVKLGALGGSGRSAACGADFAVATGGTGEVLVLTQQATPTSADGLAIAGAATIDASLADPAGGFWLAGTMKTGEGGLWRAFPSASGAQTAKDAAGRPWTLSLAWPLGCTARPALRVLVAGAAGTRFGVTDAGRVYRLDALGCHDEGPERLDLLPRAGLKLPDGRVVFAGQPGLWLGPFLTVPEIGQPTGSIVGKPVVVAWTAAPGTAPMLHRVHIDGATTGFPFWWMYTAPSATTVTAPDFLALANIFVWNDSSFIARVDRIWGPGLSINAFSTYDVEFGDWRSWSTNGRSFGQ